MADTVRSLMERYKLTDEECNKPVSDSHLEELTRYNLRRWNRLPPHLEMKVTIAKGIESSPKDESDKRYDFITQWKLAKGSGATYKKLIDALLKIHCKEDAEFVCELLGSVSPNMEVDPIHTPGLQTTVNATEKPSNSTIQTTSDEVQSSSLSKAVVEGLSATTESSASLTPTIGPSSTPVQATSAAVEPTTTQQFIPQNIDQIHASPSTTQLFTPMEIQYPTQPNTAPLQVASPATQDFAQQPTATTKATEKSTPAQSSISLSVTQLFAMHTQYTATLQETSVAAQQDTPQHTMLQTVTNQVHSIEGTTLSQGTPPISTPTTPSQAIPSAQEQQASLSASSQSQAIATATKPPTSIGSSLATYSGSTTMDFSNSQKDSPMDLSSPVKEANLEELDPVTKKRVIDKLQSNLAGIQEKYGCFAVTLCKAIEEKETTKQFQLYILGISAYESKHLSEQPIILDDVKAKIQAAQSIIDIFQILTTECCSFMNIGIFQAIMRRYYINSDSNPDLQYSQHLETYLKSHKISEFIAINSGLQKFKKEGTDDLVLKFDIQLSQKTTKVLDLQIAIVNILGIEFHTLHLIGIEKGCVVITFVLPEAVAKYLFDKGLQPSQEAEIRALSVLWLKCRNYTLKEIPHATPTTSVPAQVSAEKDAPRKRQLSQDNENEETPTKKSKKDSSAKVESKQIEHGETEEDVIMIIAGKIEVGKKLFKDLLGMKFDELPSHPHTQQEIVPSTRKDGVTVHIVDTNTVSNYKMVPTTEKFDVLVYCAQVSSTSNVEQLNPQILSYLQQVYGKDIWSHCIIVYTLSDSSRVQVYEWHSDKKVEQFTKEFERVLKDKLKVEKVTIEAIGSDDTTKNGHTIPAIPASDELTATILPDNKTRDGCSSLRDVVLLEMLKTGKDSVKLATNSVIQQSLTFPVKSAMKEEWIAAGLAVGAWIFGVPAVVIGCTLSAAAYYFYRKYKDNQ